MHHDELWVGLEASVPLSYIQWVVKLNLIASPRLTIPCLRELYSLQLLVNLDLTLYASLVHFCITSVQFKTSKTSHPCIHIHCDSRLSSPDTRSIRFTGVAAKTNGRKIFPHLQRCVNPPPLYMTIQARGGDWDLRAVLMLSPETQTNGFQKLNYHRDVFVIKNT